VNNQTVLPKIGLALGSGASRGWSHIGVIKKLLSEGIEPDIVCGTSVGAIIGGSYVAGNLDKLEQWVLDSTRSDVLRFFDIRLKQSGFVDTQRLSWFLHTLVAAPDCRIEDLPKKFGAVQQGGLADAVRASMALPGLFPAVRNDQRWLVDGGLINPVPVTICRALGADVVIAVNLNSGIVSKPNSGKQAANVNNNTGVLNKVKQQAREYSNAIFPNREEKDVAPGLFYAIANSANILAHVGMLEFHRAAEAIREGGECVARVLAEIRELTERH
jgi:NTE family protein